MHKKKYIILLKIAIIFLILLILFPILPLKIFSCKNPLLFFKSDYVKIEAKCSSQDGFLLMKDSKELGLAKGDELDHKLVGLEDIESKLDIFKYGLSSNRIKFYGDITENSDGKKILNIKMWSTTDSIMATYLWDKKLEKIYFFMIIPAIILLPICCIYLMVIKKKSN